MLNVVAIMGRLVADPELRTTPAGVNVCRFRIACDRNFAKPGEQRQADFIDVIAWRQQAEFVCRYFQKGSLVAINGRLQTNNYQDKNGTTVHPLPWWPTISTLRAPRAPASRWTRAARLPRTLRHGRKQTRLPTTAAWMTFP